MRVLFIEDNNSVRGAVGEMLTDEGWHVEVCENGIAALEMIESEIHYDLILTDYDLSGVNGIEIVRQTRQLTYRQRTWVIMFTASSVQKEASAAGVARYLRKPEDTHRIAGIIHQMICFQ